jgi:hypothetical protein
MFRDNNKILGRATKFYQDLLAFRLTTICWRSRLAWPSRLTNICRRSRLAWRPPAEHVPLAFPTGLAFPADQDLLAFAVSRPLAW